MDEPGTNCETRLLRLRPGLTIIPMPDRVQLRGGDEEIFVLETDTPQLVEKLVEALSVGTSRAELRRWADESQRELVGELLEELSRQGLLTEVVPCADEDEEISRYLSHFAAAGPGVLDRQRVQGPVMIHGHGAGVVLLCAALREHGIDAKRAEGDSPDVVPAQALVCIWEQPDLHMVLRVNEQACRDRRPCLFVDLSHGQHATVGPFYVPGEGACYQCFRQRLRENTAAVEEFDATEQAMIESGQPLSAYGVLPAFRYQAVGVACAELFAFLARHRPPRTLNRAATLDFERLKMWTEPAWRIPWCEACGSKRS